MKASAQSKPNLALRRERERRHWTQSELALKVGATYLSVCRWENGMTRPSLYYRQQLCAVFGLPPEALGLAPASAAPDAAVPGEQPSTGAAPIVWQVPFRRNPCFTGREAVLARLAARLFAGKAAALSQPQALSGLGGIGKTQTAVEYAYRHRSDYQAVFWARAETRETLQADLAQAADLLGLPERAEPDQRRLLAAVQRWLSRHDRWLLILDNLEELALVEEIVPPGARGQVLLTTRAQATGALARRLSLEELAPEEGALLLLRRAGYLAPEAPLEAAAGAAVAQEIARRLGGLPLALDQAGAYLEETGCSPAEYLARLQRYQAALLQRRGRSREHPESVSTTFALALQNVQRASPAAAELLRLCAFLAPDAIPEALLVAGAAELGETLGPVAADPLALDEVYAVLRRYSLVRRQAERQTLTMHRLVQAVLKEGLDEPAQRQWAERAVRAVSRAFPQVTYGTRAQCQVYLPQALACVALMEQYDFQFPEALHLLDRVAHYLQTIALYSQAALLLHRALHLSEQLFGPEHPSTATILDHLALVYQKQGQYPEAHLLYQRVLAIREREPGPEHLDTATTYFNLDWLYYMQGHYPQAEAAARRALEIRERVLGPDHADTLDVLTDLGAICEAQGAYEQAEAILQRALVSYEQQFGPEFPALTDPLTHLGVVYLKQERFDQAEALFRRALGINEQSRGPEHPATLMTLGTLALFYEQRGDYQEAERLRCRAWTGLEQVLGPEHRETLIELNHLAWIVHLQGRDEEAESLFRRVLNTGEHALGKDHPLLAYPLARLAQMYEHQHRYAHAQPLLQRALAIREQALGSDHPETVVIRERCTRLQEQMALAATSERDQP